MSHSQTSRHPIFDDIKPVKIKHKRAKPPPEPPIPDARRIVVKRILDHLVTSYEMQRPPEKAAHLMAIIIELEKRDQNFPPRRALAEHMQCSPFGIDAMVALALRRGLIEPKIVVKLAVAASGRETIYRQRRYVPTQELREIGEGPTRKRA